MGILNEMFGDENSDVSSYEGEFIAKGEYESRSGEILEGYKVYQKKYVFRSLALKLFIVLIAVSSSVMMIITSQGNEITPVFCLMICITIGIWFISQPINNKKNLSKALGMLEGVTYKAEVFTDKIIISDMSPRENNDIPEENENAPEENEETEESSSEDDIPPATVIHLDSPIVNFLDRSDMFILVVNKSYVFIIPKRGFSEEDTVKIREKLSLIMGVRYKAV